VIGHAAGERTIPERVAAILTGVAAAFVLVAVAVLLFLNPVWVSFEQGRTHAAELTGFADADLRAATDAILHDLVIGPPDFAVAVGGVPVLEERERAHMRDVRAVFGGFFLIAGVMAVGLTVLVAGARRAGHSERAWSAVATAMRWLTVGVVAAGVIAAVAFDQLFELFHELFFPAGTFLFDPRTDRLVQLFPFEFWSETTIVLGVVIVIAATVISIGAGRRARRATADRRAGGAATPAVAPRVEAAR
jgi:integral membrane protein (TIGR01906 family)